MVIIQVVIVNGNWCLENTPWNPVGGSAAFISSLIAPQNVPEMNIIFIIMNFVTKERCT